jgi:DNA repair exonuclease SbcCD ATPase subunit
MNQAGVAALKMAREAWGKVEHANYKDWRTYIGWTSNIAEVFRQAIKTSDDDDESDIVRYENLIIAIEEPIGSCSWKREWVSYASEYRWFKDYSLTDSAVELRREEVAECKAKIAEIKRKIEEKKRAEARKAEEAKKARIKAYWEAHADEKAKLEAEKKELADKKSKLSAEIADLDKQIKAAKPTGNVPSEDETNKVKAQIKELENKRAGLSIFAGKEKKRIGEEIASLQGRVDSLKSKIEAEKKARTAEVDKKVAPLKAKKDELEKQVSAATKRLSTIEAELTKDPEA